MIAVWSNRFGGLRQPILTSLLRHFLSAGSLATITMLFVGAIDHRRIVRPVRELAATTIHVYKTTTCGCLTKWGDPLREAGFTAAVTELSTLNALKATNGMPAHHEAYDIVSFGTKEVKRSSSHQP